MQYEIQHHGIKGQKWGVRRFQNEDGTLTPAGRSRYLNSDGSFTKEGKKYRKMVNKNWGKAYNRAADEMNRTVLPTVNQKYKNDRFDATYSTKRGQQYLKELSTSWKNMYLSNLENLVKPEAREFVREFSDLVPLMNTYDEFIKKH